MEENRSLRDRKLGSSIISSPRVLTSTLLFRPTRPWRKDTILHTKRIAKTFFDHTITHWTTTSRRTRIYSQILSSRSYLFIFLSFQISHTVYHYHLKVLTSTVMIYKVNYSWAAAFLNCSIEKPTLLLKSEGKTNVAFGK